MESEFFSSFGGVSIYSSKEKGRFKFRLGIQSYFITGDEYAEKIFITFQMLILLLNQKIQILLPF